jgi:Protein of unknown function (DUF992)
MNRASTILAVSFATLLGGAAPAAAQTVVAGLLECRAGPSTGMVVGSGRNLTCAFRPADGGPVQRYTASGVRIGLDLGVTTSSALVWTVVAPGRVGPGALAGQYAGASGSIAFVIGVGANVLVGGMENSFALQPVSVEMQEGFNIAAGGAQMTLTYYAPRVYVRKFRHRHRYH